MSKDNVGKKLAVGALIAGAAGYLAGILTAPKSGKQTREDLASGAVHVADEATAKIKLLQTELETHINKAKDIGSKLSDRAKMELDEAVAVAKDAQTKATTLLKAVKKGDAKDPDLAQAIEQIRTAKDHLGNFLRS